MNNEELNTSLLTLIQKEEKSLDATLLQTKKEAMEQISDANKNAAELRNSATLNLKNSLSKEKQEAMEGIQKIYSKQVEELQVRFDKIEQDALKRLSVAVDMILEKVFLLQDQEENND